VSPLRERELIERLRARLGPQPPHVIVGTGDDAAVLEPERGCVEVVSTDSLIEDVHFRRAWTPLDAVGTKAVATSLSDLAAMGARPRATLLSLALPDGFSITDFDALVGSFIDAARQARAPLVGGNVSRSPGPLVVDTTAIGAVRRRGVMTRGGGRPGCALYVTGRLGGAAAGLSLLTAGVDRGSLDADELDSVRRYERPEARLRTGWLVGRARAAAACVDLSDGLADGARQIAAASGTGVQIEAADVPLHPGARTVSSRLGLDPLRMALSGGEDYELLFAIGPRQHSRFRSALRRCPDVSVARVGVLTEEPALVLCHPGGATEPLPEGFGH
jgi:thiamine-monophosphate kinase